MADFIKFPFKSNKGLLIISDHDFCYKVKPLDTEREREEENFPLHEECLFIWLWEEWKRMKTLKEGVRQQLTPYDDKSANLFFGTVTTTTATATAAQCSWIKIQWWPSKWQINCIFHIISTSLSMVLQIILSPPSLYLWGEETQTDRQSEVLANSISNSFVASTPHQQQQRSRLGVYQRCKQ